LIKLIAKRCSLSFELTKVYPDFKSNSELLMAQPPLWSWLMFLFG
jgi:hypothetical protein